MKDPAFLFYTSDFLTGTQFMSDEQVGVYIRILCAQHQHGHLSERKMQQLCRGIAGADAVQEVMCKFERDADGNFYNARLDQEINKRKEFAEKQRDKAKKRWRDKDAVALPGQCLLENENENENRNRKGNETAETKTKGTAEAETETYTGQTNTGAKTEKPTRKKFVPPEVGEVAAYMAEINYPGFVQQEAERFVNYYTGNGWVVGKSKMKDWKATVRNWKIRHNEQQQQTVTGIGKPIASQPTKHGHSHADLFAAVARQHGFGNLPTDGG